MKRAAISVPKKSATNKKNRVFSADIQWCFDNKDDLTLASFVEKYGIINKQYALSRYGSIISKAIFGDDSERLTSELTAWRQTEEYKKFWIDRINKKTQLDVQEGCTQYVSDSAQDALGKLTSMSRNEPTDKPVLSSEESIPPPSSSTHSEPSSSNSTLSSSYTSPTVNSGNKSDSTVNNDNRSIPPLSLINSAQNTNVQDVENSPVLAPWLFEEADIALLFTKFKQAVAQMSTDHLFLIESSIHELLSLSNILLLAPQQYSQLVIDIFTEEILNDLDSYLLKECLDPRQDMSNNVFTKLSRIVNNVESNNQSKYDAEIELLMLGKDLCPIQKSLILGIKAYMRKLPLLPIKNKQSLGECELFTMYFDPLLSALFSDPDKNILLRWSNVTCDESADMRPDATISKIQQRNFGQSLGFGEVKVARPTTDNHALCLDLLRLGAFCKDTIDMNKLQAALAFQINGFSIIFYLMRLRHDV
ncbi:hypothetical protein BDF20DRAFT_1005100 [Mycotypha africana]|uniref:uncharacterized protein n=1 Tax=Mycotypha africana TaxID=64632 RepID=UPI00230175C5|nr:uncharacterized protein BDF20DRAFT_1005100 [Mycotypha africana]KAI8967120.1 hypothetical protein BDF20DRAFT_1005100 [Mycotypha africana]